MITAKKNTARMLIISCMMLFLLCSVAGFTKLHSIKANTLLFQQFVIQKWLFGGATGLKAENPDIIRLTKDDLPPPLETWIQECDKAPELYVKEYENRYYIYCNMVQSDYAWQPVIKDNSAIITLFPIQYEGPQSQSYALLSAPLYPNFTVQAENHRVQLTQDQSAVNFDTPEMVLQYILSNDYTAAAFASSLTDAYSSQYDTQAYTATAEFSGFSGATQLMAHEFSTPTKVGFSIAANISGSYKVVLLSSEGEVLITASSVNWQRASRPVDVPAGTLSVFLVGEEATGALEITLYP